MTQQSDLGSTAFWLAVEPKQRSQQTCLSPESTRGQVAHLAPLSDWVPCQQILSSAEMIPPPLQAGTQVWSPTQLMSVVYRPNNVRKLQDTKPTYKNQLYFHILPPNYLKKKERKQPHLYQHQILRIRFNQGSERYLHWNLRLWWKKLKISQLNEKISHVHRLEELMLLQCQHYPKSCRDSMQSLFIGIFFFTDLEKTILKRSHKGPK